MSHDQAHALNSADHTGTLDDAQIPSTIARDAEIHAQSHAHNGSDGSGTVAHADTTGKTANDHHNESHASRHQDGGADELDLYNLDIAVGTATGVLGSEIVIGATPGGELGGTWASPTVDATHAGSAHHAQSHGAADHTDVTREIWIPAEQMTPDTTASHVTIGSGVTAVRAIRCNDAVDEGAAFNILIPNDYASGSFTIAPVWGAGAGATGAVRWQCTSKPVASAVVLGGAGTTDTWTGASATRAANELTKDTAGTITSTPVAGSFYRLVLRRLGTDGADTHGADADLIGVLLSYTASQ